MENPREARWFGIRHELVIGAEVTVWCSNDYLGGSQHPAVLEAIEETLRAVGAGVGGTRNISGNSQCAPPARARARRSAPARGGADFLPRAMVANDAALSTLARELPDMVVFSDALNLASTIAGIRNSRAEKTSSAITIPRTSRACCNGRRPSGRSWCVSSRSTRWTATSRRSASSATLPSASPR